MRIVETPEGKAVLLDRAEVGLIEGALRALEDPRSTEWKEYVPFENTLRLLKGFAELSQELAKG